jgi:hypothetical protein
MALAVAVGCQKRSELRQVALAAPNLRLTAMARFCHGLLKRHVPEHVCEDPLPILSRVPVFERYFVRAALASRWPRFDRKDTILPNVNDDPTFVRTVALFGLASINERWDRYVPRSEYWRIADSILSQSPNIEVDVLRNKYIATQVILISNLVAHWPVQKKRRVRSLHCSLLH